MIKLHLFSGICDGRLMQFDLTTNKVEVLLERLCCANGVQLSPDGNHLVVAEGSALRVLVVNIESREVVKTVNLPCELSCFNILS